MQNFGRENAHALLGTWKPGSLTLTKFIAKQLSPPQRPPARHPNKNSNNRKNRKRAGNDGKREKAGASLLFFPFQSCPARSLFLSPPTSLQRKAASAGERGKTAKLEAVCFVALFPYKV